MTPPVDPTPPVETGPRGHAEPASAHREPRPLIERIGLAVIAALLAVLFGTVAALSWAGGEVFLAVMGALGCLMTAWVGVLTLIRG